MPMVTPFPRWQSGMAETKESPAGSGDSATATSCLSASGSTSSLGMYSSTCSTRGQVLGRFKDTSSFFP